MIGAGTGGATKSILRHTGPAFSSYTYTDISTGFFEEAQSVFADQAGKIVFKTLDIEKDVVEQGYAEHSYDLVIASLVLHATRDLRKTLENTRRLLKPGGFLLLQEITNIDVLRVGFAMSGLPGWWLGREDGRRYSPCITSAEWHSLLLDTGFSGIDSITPEIDILPRPLSVIAAQATNEQVEFLRKPLSQPGQTLGASTKDLVVIGGKHLRTIVLIEEITHILRPWQFSITRVRSLEELAPSHVSQTSLILCITELDKPIWEDFSIDSMSGLKHLLDFERTILWVTQGCRSENPYMNMSVGFGRSLALENPDLRLQFMDLDALEKPSPHVLAEALLRLHVTDVIESQEASNSILWSTEQEIAYERGIQTIPRLRVSQKLNDRYNASKRIMIEMKDSQECTFQLRPSDSGYDLIEDSFFDRRAVNKEIEWGSEVHVQVAYSLLKPSVTVDNGNAFVVIGNDLTQGITVVGLSRVNGNRLAMQKDNLIPCNISKEMQPRFLAALEVEVNVDTILSFCTQGSRILIHEPARDVAARLSARAAEKNLQFWFSTSSGEPMGDSWLSIHPRAPDRTIKVALPLRVSVFINCSTDANHENLSRRISSCLPTSCLRVNISEVDAYMGKARSSYQESLDQFSVAAGRALSEVYKHRSSNHKLTSLNIITPAAAARLNTQELQGSTIIEWTTSGEIPLQLSSVESQTHFIADVTYVFFGLTSDLGTSLCEWFVSRGARNLVLTSRNPKIDSRWLEQMEKAGARVEVFAKFVQHSVTFPRDLALLTCPVILLIERPSKLW